MAMRASGRLAIGPRAVVVLAGLLAAAAVTLALLARGRNVPEAHALPWQLCLLAPVYLCVPIVGALLWRRRPGNVVAGLLLLAGIVVPLAMALDQYAVLGLYAEPGSVPAARWAGPWIAAWFVGPPLLAGPLLLLLPDGRPRSRGWGAAAVALGVCAALAGLGLLTGDPAPDFPGVDNPYGLGDVGGVLQLGLATLPLGALIGTVGLWVRARRGTEHERLQLRPLVVIAGALLVAYLLCVPALSHSAVLLVELLGSIALALACLAASAGRGLWPFMPAPRREAMHVALSVLAGGIAVAVVFAGASAFGARPGISFAVAASAGAAALALRAVLQRAVDRLLFGDRDDPTGALRRLAERLAAAPEPDEAPVTLARAVADALAVPYVAVELGGEGAPAQAAVHGTPPAHSERHVVALQHRGREVGRIVVGTARPDQGLAPGGRRLFEDLARQAGPAMAAAGLTLDLERSRAELVSAREEERRRLRDDLHDGLGPELAALAMSVDLARRELPPGAAALDSQLDALREGLDRQLEDVRRLVYGLRPPALDELGLVPALREHAGRLEGRGALTITLDAPDVLPPLPAAVEVAALRIAQEALTNVARHSGARRCEVRLSLNGGLVLEVEDDGRGIALGASAGVGLTSMRRRATELGGTFVVAPRLGGGTAVRALLPLRDAG